MNTKPPKISVLVPVYKVEPYLQRCIDSVLAQDFQDWEMILVDDGSPDRCPEICDEAAGKDERITVVHKENGGLPSARRTAFSLSRGEYIVHVDSDDWLMPNALSVLYGYILKGDYDIVRGRNRRVHIDGTYQIEGSKTLGVTKGMEECLINVLQLGFLPYLWGAIYRRELFSDELFEKVKSFSIGEDWVTNIAVAKNVKTVLCVDEVVCNYFINDNSYMQAKVCSHEYGLRVNQYLDIICGGCPETIMNAICLNKVIRCVTECFTPELPFYKGNYSYISSCIKNDNIKRTLYSIMDNKFLRFINNFFLFYCYSRSYCFLYKYIKLRGKIRVVIP